MSKIKIGIIDDQHDLITGLQRNLSVYRDLEILFISRNGKDAIDKSISQKPDLLFMDIQMPVMNGIETTREIKKHNSNIKIIMLTVVDDENIIFEAIMAGANGYITKDSPPEKIHDSIIECIEGGAPMSPAIAFKAMQLIRKNNPIQNSPIQPEQFDLTKREIEILEKISSGQTYKQIGDLLFISPKTVRKHIENIYGKLRVHNKLEAVDIARKNNIIL